MKKVFYSPGPDCNTDTYQVHDFGGEPTEKELAEIGHEMAIQHYESYGDYDEEESGIEQEYDYCWYELDDPEVQGKY